MKRGNRVPRTARRDVRENQMRRRDRMVWKSELGDVSRAERGKKTVKKHSNRPGENQGPDDRQRLCRPGSDLPGANERNDDGEAVIKKDAYFSKGRPT